MLIKCPECQLQVSDKAITCPHCGYPIKQSDEKPRRENSKKRKYKRLPNGFGQITELKNQKLRKRFRAMVTVGFNEHGRPICKLLKPVSYFKTYNEAYTALVNYNQNPYEITEDITFKRLFDLWEEKHNKEVKREGTYSYYLQYIQPLMNMKISKIRISHLRRALDNPDIPRTTYKNIKNLFNMMWDYAVEYELASSNIARDFKLPKEIAKKGVKTDKTHVAFSAEEISLLWSKINDPDARLLLVGIYSGFRPNELLTLETNKVDDRFMTNGSKTEAGLNRRVPIHPAIMGIVQSERQRAIKAGDKYLFNLDTKNRLRYFEIHFTNIREKLGISDEHRAHDLRKTFITLAKKYNVDEYAIKYIVGHTIKDITEKVYTERSDEWLISEISKIKKEESL